jgi:RNA polymerase sigma-70 factor (ECF subfamily)
VISHIAVYVSLKKAFEGVIPQTHVIPPKITFISPYFLKRFNIGKIMRLTTPGVFGGGIMLEDMPFDEIVARLFKHDSAIEIEIFDRYKYRLCNLARSRLDRAIRRRVDPDEVVASVFKSFFIRHADGRLKVAELKDLWTILALLTRRKCCRRVEYHRAALRDIRREVENKSLDSDSFREAFDRNPTAQEAALLTETLELLMRDLNKSHREILVLSLQGYTVREICKLIRRSARTVQEVLKRIRERLEAMAKEQ